jgi:feruloyl-CoA hydratase/lyase
MSEWKTVKVDLEGSIAVVTLNRPQKRNAMSPQLHIDMVDVLETLRYDNASKVLVITGVNRSAPEWT